MSLTTAGRAGTVVSPHRVATEAGVAVLANGGNAVDAAIVTNAVLGVVAPETCGIGGDLFALVYHQGRVTCLDASGWAGSGVSAETLRGEGHRFMPPRHRFTVTVPGCVAGWGELAARHGSLPWEGLLAPAIEHALEGFEVSTELADSLAAMAEYRGETLSGETGGLGGPPPHPGETMVRTDLADTLTGIAGSGPSGFYTGPVAGAISRATKGALTLEDLAGYQAEWVEPLRLEVLGHEGWTIPPSSQGYLTLVTIALFERLDWRNRHPADTHHALIESYRAAVADRDQTLADRRFLDDDWYRRLSPDAFDQLAATIDPETTGDRPVPRVVPGGTAFMCATDGGGMAVSLIQSNFWGLGSGLGAAGFVLHNRGGGFDLRPGHPNQLHAGKRPLHTLSPTLWTAGGELKMVLGTRGGHQQPQILAQMATAILDRGMPPDQAMNLPRWAAEIPTPESDPPISFESRIEPSVTDELRRRGHRVETGPAWERGRGPVAVITTDGEMQRGYADPRVDTAAAGTVGGSSQP